MMHDALRADALAALLAFDPASAIDTPTQVKQDREEHSAIFEKAVADSKATAGDPKVKQALNELAQPLTNYIDSAKYIVGRSASDPAATRRHF
jgi:methyl-accepting chemotaxis protein